MVFPTGACLQRGPTYLIKQIMVFATQITTIGVTVSGSYFISNLYFNLVSLSSSSFSIYNFRYSIACFFDLKTDMPHYIIIAIR